MILGPVTRPVDPKFHLPRMSCTADLQLAVVQCGEFIHTILELDAPARTHASCLPDAPRGPRRNMAHATAPTGSPPGRPTSPVFESLDLTKEFLDFLDAPTVSGARPTSTMFRTAGSAVPGRISLETFNSISAQIIYTDLDYDSDNFFQ